MSLLILQFFLKPLSPIHIKEEFNREWVAPINQDDILYISKEHIVGKVRILVRQWLKAADFNDTKPKDSFMSILVKFIIENV